MLACNIVDSDITQLMKPAQEHGHGGRGSLILYTGSKLREIKSDWKQNHVSYLIKPECLKALK